MVNASCKLLVAVLVLALAIQSTSSQEISSATLDTADQGSNGGGILSFLLKPVKAIMYGASKLLGLPVDNVKGLVMDGFDEVQVRAFKFFMRIYNKTYSTPTELRRHMKIFLERRKMIEQSIRDFAQGRSTFEMRQNAFTDFDENDMKALTSLSPPKTYVEMDDEERDLMMKADNGQEELSKSVEVLDEDGTITINVKDKPNLASRYIDDAKNGVNESSIDDSGLTVTYTVQKRIPATKDWRTSGCVADPIDQGSCGACYAIATMNTLETMRCIHGNTLSALSPQQVIDCSTPKKGYMNFGCNGGWPTRVLKYLQDVRIASREVYYPYVRRQNSCKLSIVESKYGRTALASPTGTTLRYEVLNNEDDILRHVAETGPVITAMRVLSSFLMYSRGIYDDEKCSGRRDDVSHAIVIVGYGRENGRNYWLIKNSWGREWGENGYGKFLRGKRACSIGTWGWVITS